MPAEWTDADLRTDLEREAAPIARTMSTDVMRLEESRAWLRYELAKGAVERVKKSLDSHKLTVTLLKGKVSDARKELEKQEALLVDAVEEVSNGEEFLHQAYRMMDDAKHQAAVYRQAQDLFFYGPARDEDEDEDEDEDS